MQKPKHIVIVAGEESGDLHAAKLIKQLKEIHPNLLVSGIGGKHMQAAGVELIADLAQYGVTGITEVFRYFKIIRRALQDIKQHLSIQKPDLLILVDYPGFNLSLARYAKRKLGLKIIYYISPQIWAWKAKRIQVIKECIDIMAVILPFEKEIYDRAGVPAYFVGHPLLEKISSVPTSPAAREQLGLPLDRALLALLPGSRVNEIERHMPILIETATLLHQENPQFHFIIPIAGTLNKELLTSYAVGTTVPITFINGQALECMAAADFVVVASGTASLECALLQKPMCIIYKSSWLTALAASQLIRVKFIGLCNLLANRMIVPEFLHYDCNAKELSQYVLNFYADPQQPQQMLKQLSSIKESLSSKKSDCSLLELIQAEMT